MDMSLVMLSQELERLRKSLELYQKYLDKNREFEGAQLITAAKKKSGGAYHCARMKGEKDYKYIRKEDGELVRAVSEYKVVERAVKDLSRNIKEFENLLRKAVPCDTGSICERVAPVYRDAGAGILVRLPGLLSGRGEEWHRQMEERYRKRKPFKEAGLKHRCSNGLRVRSKSELILVDSFLRRGLPFFYEAEIEMNGKTVHPDFLVFSEKLGRVILWEHFGMMTESRYKEEANTKIWRYAEAGWRFGYDLLVTYDDDDGGIDMRIINGILDAFF